MIETDATPTPPTEPTTKFKSFKKLNRPPANKRIRLSDDASDDEHSAEIKRKARDAKTGFVASSSKRRKKGEEDDVAADTAETGSSLQVSFAASGTAASLASDMATRTLDVDGTEEKDAQPKILAGDEAEGLYQGMNAYKEYVNKRTDNTTQSNANRIRAGPLRVQTNVRISCRFDYQPDICKDYKETGYCGYGDSCKFMHDRGDYKTGWQLDQEWDAKQKEREAGLDPNRYLVDSDKEEEEEEEEDDLPFACPICREEFKEPIVTKCKHYFCERCALRHHSKSLKCFICGAATQGTFTPAKDLKAKLKERQERIAAREAEIRAQVKKQGGGDDEGGDDDEE